MVRVKAAVHQAQERLGGQRKSWQLLLAVPATQLHGVVDVEDDLPLGIVGGDPQADGLTGRFRDETHEHAEPVDELADGHPVHGRCRIERDRDIPGVHGMLAEAQPRHAGGIELHRAERNAQLPVLVGVQRLVCLDQHPVGG